MPDKLSKAEIRKDALQDGVTAASQAVGTVTTIITTAIGDLARAVGGFATEIFEIRDAARRAGRDHLDVVPSPADDAPGPDDRFDHPGAPGQAPKSS
ncbi:MAG: hypothetical protein JWQ67_2084 [Marmoricola sp.]|jgi:hypothetical protein|nr:hypothetical protein [Marmoricola sp.]